MPSIDIQMANMLVKMSQITMASRLALLCQIEGRGCVDQRINCSINLVMLLYHKVCTKLWTSGCGSSWSLNYRDCEIWSNYADQW